MLISPGHLNLMAALALSIIFISSLVTKKRFVNRLRMLDNSIWERLGRPGIFPEGVLGSTQFLKFVWGRRYEALSDPKLTVLGGKMRIALFVQVSLIILALAYAVWLAQHFRPSRI